MIRSLIEVAFRGEKLLMKPLYPLRFEPIFRRYLWGGRRLATELHKPLGEGHDYAESWEVVDHGDDQSCVLAGDYAGWTLQRVLRELGTDLLGAGRTADRFPLLFKFLDCQRNLSVQVHPSDEQAQRLSPPDLGKTEAWVILSATPGSVVYAGLKRGFDRAALAREVNRGTTELCLHQLTPRGGDCLLIPAGTVHALGAGLLVAEIQQSSDTTYRLFDWNRVDAAGRPRTLHIEQSLDTIDYDRGPIQIQQPQPTTNHDCQSLVQCDKFALYRWTTHERQRLDVRSSCRLIVVLAGHLRLAGDPHLRPLGVGDCALVPAGMEAVDLEPLTLSTWLEVSLPDLTTGSDRCEVRVQL